MRLDQYLARNGQPVSVNEGQFLLRQGEASAALHFLQSGLLKATYVTADGKESIKTFFADGAIVGSFQCAAENAPVPFSVVALEDSRLLRFALGHLRAAAKTDLELANELIERLLQIALRKEQRERAFLTMTPYERYCALREQDPRILERVAQYDIALYLGVTPVALSRMKGRALRARV